MSAHRAVDLMIQEADDLHQQGRYAEALRAAQRGREAAKSLGDLGLEVRAAEWEAAALRMLGEYGAALPVYTWILAVAQDPTHRVALSQAGVDWQVASAHIFWVTTAQSLQLPLTELLGVLNDGEAWLRFIGCAHWRAGFLFQRGEILGELGRSQEALGCLEEALALKERHPETPGFTLSSHRWKFAEWLRREGRVSEAEPHLSRVLDDPASAPYDRFAALDELARCASYRGNAEGSLEYATGALAEAELLGPNVLSVALNTLTTAQRATARLEQAEASARRQLTLARQLESPVRLYFALGSVVDVALDRGQLDEARARLAEMASHAAILDRARGSATFSGDVERRGQRLAAVEGSST